MTCAASAMSSCPKHGHLRPGLFVAGGDSHTTTNAGAFGCYAAGFGARPT